MVSVFPFESTFVYPITAFANDFNSIVAEEAIDARVEGVLEIPDFSFKPK